MVLYRRTLSQPPTQVARKVKQYLMAYTLWLIAVITMAAIALEWYRRIERIGWTEVAARLRGLTDDEPDVTE